MSVRVGRDIEWRVRKCIRECERGVIMSVQIVSRDRAESSGDRSPVRRLTRVERVKKNVRVRERVVVSRRLRILMPLSSIEER